MNILFVCLGNICRSPAAEGILESMLVNNPQHSSLNVQVQSCGLGNWHTGNLADPRMREATKRRGVILSKKAQVFQSHFFDQFDYILAADHKVLRTLYDFARNPQDKSKIHLITAFSKSYKNEEIPDPYYGGDESFELVLDMLEDACEGILQKIKKDS